MALTKEERKQRLKDNQDRRARLSKEFPGVYIYDKIALGWPRLQMLSGDESLTIQVCNKGDGDYEGDQIRMTIDDARELIHALTTRLNNEIRRFNAKVARIELPAKLEEIQ